MTDHRLRFIVNAFYFTLILGAFFLLMKYALPVLLPFAFAFAIAALLRRPTATLCSRFSKIPAKAVALGVILIFYATIGTATTLLISALLEELFDFISQLPAIISEQINNIAGGRREWLESMPSWVRKIVSTIMGSFDGDSDMLGTLADTISQPLLDLVGKAGSLAMKLPTIIITVMITVIASFFIAADYDGVISMLRDLCPKSALKMLSRIKGLASDTTISLLKTYAFLTLLTFTQLALGFAVLNLFGAEINYVMPLALLISFVDILPVLGVGTVIIPWAAAEFVAQNTSRAVMLLILYAVVAIVRNFLEPKLVGKRFGLHPLLTLAALYTGGKLFGFIGIFVLPLTAIILVRLKEAGCFERKQCADSAP